MRSQAFLFDQIIPITIPPNTWTKDREGFPWTITFFGLKICTIENQHELNLFEPVKTTVTLAISNNQLNSHASIPHSSKSLDEITNTFAVVFHIDTSPIAIYLRENQIKFLYNLINILSSYTTTVSSFKSSHKPAPIEIAQRPVSPDSNNVDIKEFFGIAASSTKDTLTAMDSEAFIDSTPLKQNTFSLLLQWTVTKLSFNLFGQKRNSECKLLIELEDIISSVDQQEVYFKIKSKIGSISSQLFEREAETSPWIVNELMGLNLKWDPTTSVEKSNNSFFDLIITKAETGNVHSKWGTQKKDKSLNDYLTEIVIGMQQIDVRIDIELLEYFIPMMNMMVTKHCDDGSEIEVQQNVMSASSLPLIYFEWKGLHIYMPSKYDNEKYSTFICKVSFFCIYINDIHRCLI